jgi:hypothetical protein
MVSGLACSSRIAAEWPLQNRIESTYTIVLEAVVKTIAVVSINTLMASTRLG